MSPKSYCKHQPVSRPKSPTSLEERRGFCGGLGKAPAEIEIGVIQLQNLDSW